MSSIPVRVMDQEKDYRRMGTRKGVIEKWEDGKRDDDRAGVYEWWYFDFIFEDGSKAVIHFNTKDNKTIQQDGTLPSVVIKITAPDGKEYKDNVLLKKEDASFGKEQCDVHFGEHFITGDLRTYQIHVARTGGQNGSDGAGGTGEASDVGADLTLASTSKPWRPGAGGFAFGEDEAGYFTWLCAVPRGKVTGTLYYNGEAHRVQGAGYHDHQWGNVVHNKTWDHWIWGRQDFGDYTAVLFDIGTQKAYGYQRLPMFFVEDNDGNLVFEDMKTPKCRFVQEYREALSGKCYPKEIEYVFTDGTKKVTYRILQKNELESRDPTAALNPLIKGLLKLKHMHPSTTRNFAEGEITLEDSGKTITRKSSMIYEFIYMGETVKEKMENR